MTKIIHCGHKMWCGVCFTCIWSEIVGLDEGRKCSNSSRFWWNLSCTAGYIAQWTVKWQERPYHDDSTASRLLNEVKHRRAWLVLRWGTTPRWNPRCCSFAFHALFCNFSPYCPHNLFATPSILDSTPCWANCNALFSQEKSFLLSFYWFLNYTNSTLIHISTLQFQYFNPSVTMGVLNSLIIRINCFYLHKINVNKCKSM